MGRKDAVGEEEGGVLLALGDSGAETRAEGVFALTGDLLREGDREGDGAGDELGRLFPPARPFGLPVSDGDVARYLA